MDNGLLQKEEIFHQIIHDLKSPLASVLGLSEIFIRVLSPEMNENQKEVIRKIKKHTQFALELIEDLLEVQNLNINLSVEKKPIQIKTLIENSAQGHLIKAAEKNIDLSVQVTDDIIIPADERRLKQVLDNLISNALKFSHPETQITITSDHDDSFCYINISDQGIGIKPEEMQNLFQPFSQISGRPTGGEKSTGLGLSIVKKIVDMHGGDINIHSVQDKGSTFTIKLPLVE